MQFWICELSKAGLNYWKFCGEVWFGFFVAASSKKSCFPMLFAVASALSMILHFLWRSMPSERVRILYE